MLAARFAQLREVPKQGRGNSKYLLSPDLTCGTHGHLWVLPWDILHQNPKSLHRLKQHLCCHVPG